MMTMDYKLDTENIPAALVEREQWIVWAAVPQADGKVDKVPYSVKTGQKCNVTDPKNFVSFEVARSYFQKHHDWYGGIGFCLTHLAGLIGIDLDDAIDFDGRLKSWAAAILAVLPQETYVEKSPSGKGLRAFLFGELPPGRRKRNLPGGESIEIYDSGRFLTVTGNRYGTGTDIPDAQDVIDKVHRTWFADMPLEKTSMAIVSTEPALPDEALLEKMFAAKNGAEIKQLWDGDIDRYNGDDSAADQALLCHLAFWTRKNVEQMERLFTESTLGQRDKWRNRHDYRDRSIKQAIKYVTTTYENAQQSEKNLGCVLNEAELVDILDRIRTIDSTTSHIELPGLLNEILDHLASIDESQALAILRQEIKVRFALANDELEAYRKKVKEKRKELERESANKSPSANQVLEYLGASQHGDEIHPAIDFVGNAMYFGLMVRGQLFAVSSERKLCSFADAGLKLKHTHLDYSRFSAGAIRRFLDGQAAESIGLFRDIRSYIQRFVYFTNPAHSDLLAVWCMGTYLFPIFRHYPYLWLNAEKGSGKTTALEVMLPICFNGQMVVSPTPAVLFREVATNRTTLLIDEFERMTKQNKELGTALFEILNAGYNREGQVKRAEAIPKGGFKLTTYSAYSPKIFSGIQQIDDVLRDRTIQVRMLRKGGHDVRERYKITEEVRALQQNLCDRLYMFALSYAAEIATIYHSDLMERDYLKHLNNRELDLWEPLASIFYAVDKEGLIGLMEPLIALSKQSYDEKSADNLIDNDTSKLILGLKTLLASSVPWKEVNEGNEVLRAYRAPDVVEFFRQKLDLGDFVFDQSDLTRRLKSLNVIARQRRWNDKEKRPITYALSSNQVDELMERFNVQDG